MRSVLVFSILYKTTKRHSLMMEPAMFRVFPEYSSWRLHEGPLAVWAASSATDGNGLTSLLKY